MQSESSSRKFRSLEDIYESCQLVCFIAEPMNYEEASKQEVWKKAMKNEIEMIEKNQTWELVNLPAGKKEIGLKWVFKTKYNADGTLQKHKARLVVKGYAQIPGVDFFETFSPVARLETIRTVLAVAAQNQWEVFQLDVKSTFLNGKLEEEVYVEQPKGFEICGQEEKVYKLKKALYGLKQAPRAWYSRINMYLLERNFKGSKSEPTLYKKSQGKDEIIIVCIYVDDLIFTGNSDSLMKIFKQEMMSEFDMTDLGSMRYFLGMEVMQTPSGIFLSQQKYANDLLEKFQMQKCNPAMTPMNVDDKLLKDDGSGKADEKKFRSLIGGLIYLTHTRPDIMYAVNYISRFMHNPTNHHFGAAKRILKYVAGTKDLGIMYTKVDDFRLIGFCDSSWANYTEDRKSTTGHCMSLGSGMISWTSKKQATTALSSTEAEYIASTAAACQCIWMRRILEDLGEKQREATTLFCDNNSAIALAYNPVFHGRTKHIEIKYHFIREQVEKEEINLEFCRTDEQVADILTKALSENKFKRLRSMLGLWSLNQGRMLEV